MILSLMQLSLRNQKKRERPSYVLLCRLKSFAQASVMHMHALQTGQNKPAGEMPLIFRVVGYQSL